MLAIREDTTKFFETKYSSKISVFLEVWLFCKVQQFKNYIICIYIHINLSGSI